MSSSIYVYGWSWDGTTIEQINNLKDELHKNPNNIIVDQALRFIDCDKEENDVCQFTRKFSKRCFDTERLAPLTIVHGDNQQPSLEAMTAACKAASQEGITTGIRSAEDLILEWHTANA